MAMNTIRMAKKAETGTALQERVNSARQTRTLHINQSGLIDISTSEPSLLTDDHHFERGLKALNANGKKRLYKGLLKKISNCLNQSSRLSKEKRSLMNANDEKEVQRINDQHHKICCQERILWQRINILYDMLSRHHT
jgi:hypothetical protein